MFALFLALTVRQRDIVEPPERSIKGGPSLPPCPQRRPCADPMKCAEAAGPSTDSVPHSQRFFAWSPESLEENFLHWSWSFVCFFCIVQSSGWKSPKQEQTTTGQVSQVHTCTCLWGRCEDGMSCICPTPGLQFSPYTWLLKKLSKQAEEFLQVRKFWETRELQASPGSLCPWFTMCLLYLPW